MWITRRAKRFEAPTRKAVSRFPEAGGACCLPLAINRNIRYSTYNPYAHDQLHVYGGSGLMDGTRHYVCTLLRRAHNQFRSATTITPAIAISSFMPIWAINAKTNTRAMAPMRPPTGSRNAFAFGCWRRRVIKQAQTTP